MPFEPKTAKDLPAGAKVETFWSVITKTGVDQWTNRMGDPFTDAEIDNLLSNGGMLTRVPTGTQTKEADRTVLDQAADIIEPHIDGDFKRRERAEGNAADLATAGLLNDGQRTGSTVIRDRAEAVLQCRHGWRTAETIAAELDAAGLLKGGHRHG